MVAINRDKVVSDKYRFIHSNIEEHESSDGSASTASHSVSPSLSQEKCNERVESSPLRESFSHLAILLVGIVVGLASSYYFLEVKYATSIQTLSNEYRHSHDELQQRYTTSLQKIENKLFEAKSSSSSCERESRQLQKQILQFSSLEKKYNLMKIEQSQLVRERDRVTNELTHARRTINEYENEIKLLSQHRRKNEEQLKYTVELKNRIKGQDQQLQKLRQNFPLWENEVQRLHDAVSITSLRSLQQRYGRGPHRVNFQVNYSFGNSRMTKSFTIELAPDHMMPHSVLTFLDAVSAKFYDGYAFAHSTDQLIVIKDSDERTKPTIYQRSIKTLHDNPLIFQEYNPKFPHKEMTLGFLGKKLGGPSFYISKKDNSDAHAFDPSLKDEHGFPQKPGEPCFAKVIQGFETIHEIDHLLVSNQQAHNQQVKLEIKSAKIIF